MFASLSQPWVRFPNYKRLDGVIALSSSPVLSLLTDTTHPNRNQALLSLYDERVSGDLNSVHRMAFFQLSLRFKDKRFSRFSSSSRPTSSPRKKV